MTSPVSTQTYRGFRSLVWGLGLSCFQHSPAVDLVSVAKIGSVKITVAAHGACAAELGEPGWAEKTKKSAQLQRPPGVTCPVSKRPTVEARRVWFGLRVLLCLGQKRPTVEARSVMLCRLRREGKERVSERERASERARAREAEREGERGRGQG
jgi:hypothetical protein